LETVVLEREGPISILTMARQEKLNALNEVMIRELSSSFADVADDRECRVVILTGAGGNFCSGADLSARGDRQEAPDLPERMASLRNTFSLVEAIIELPKPILAAVSGFAVGAGCNLALACDITVAAEDARFSEIFVRRGLAADMGGTWILPRLIGLHRAKELAFTGDVLSAAEALGMGLINRVVPLAVLMAEAKALAGKIARNAPLALRLTKEGINRSSGMSIRDAIDHEVVAQTICGSSQDAREGIRAFLEKREARFLGS
jgi:2-(1,2-epoxy-1,2-dihydrophenyl)acetyl-CoA isomerase